MILSLSLGAAIVLSQGPGSTTANFLKIGAGARAVGMGEAFAAVTDDPTALYWNPAGLALFRGTGFSATHGEWMQGVQHEYLSLIHRLPKAGGIGGSLNYLSSGLIRQTLEKPSGDYGGEGALVNGASFAASAGYAQRLGTWFPGPFLRKTLLGLKVSYMGQRLIRAKRGAASLDLGAIYELKRKKTYLALVLHNLGTSVYQAPQPMIFQLGFSHRVRNLLTQRDQLLMAAGADGHGDTGFRGNLGIEYRRPFGRQALFLRSGYRLGGTLGALAGLTVGAGYETPLGIYDFGLDYAFVPYGVLGLAHRVSMSFRSGGRILPPEVDLRAPPEFYVDKDKVKINLDLKRTEPLKTWKVEIRDSSGAEVRNFSGKMEDPPWEISWDGRNTLATPVPPGPYHLKITVEDDEEQSAESPKRLVEARVEPTPTQTPTVTPVPKAPYTFTFDLPGDLLFDSGQSELKTGAFPLLGQAVSIIQARYEGASVLIAGFTDNVRVKEDSPFGSNAALSMARAESVKRFLAEKGLPAGSLVAMGYGASGPAASNDTEEGRAKNRRVQMIIFGDKIQTAPDLVQEARLLMSGASWKAALEALGRAAALDPSNAEAYKLAGVCYLQLGDRGQAKQAYSRALQLKPGDKEVETWLSGLR